MKGYKVVDVSGGNLKSTSCATSEIAYSINNWVSRPDKCGPLAVFTNKRFARCFATGLDYVSIFLCEFKKSKDDHLWDSRGNSRYIQECPHGTKFADRVKLIKEIKL